MSMNNAEIVLNNFDQICFYKQKLNYDVRKIMEELGFGPDSDTNYFNLFNIAYQFTHDRALAQSEMEKYTNSLNNSFVDLRSDSNDEPVVINDIIVNLCFLTDLAYNKYHESERISIEYERLIINLVTQRTCFVSTNGNVKIHDLVPIENRKDEFGSWRFDPLAGHIKIYAQLNNAECFPKTWKLNNQSKIVFEMEMGIPENVQQQLDSKISLKTFLELTLGSSSMIKVFHDLYIGSVEDLKKLNEEGWKLLENRIPAACMSVKTAIDRIDTPHTSDRDHSRRTPAEELSDWHKVKLFLYYSLRDDSHKKFGHLDLNALEKGFEEQANDTTFNIGPTLANIKDALKVYTTPLINTSMRERSHGMLLYGPPGTGKTKLSTIIIKKAGLAEIVEPLSSAELNRSLVGATEKLLMALFQRARYCPHLLCCIAIDEVDALTPKRNDKAAGHKVDALSLLLSLIGGIKDVPNVFVIASTNRLNKIDEAFARRLQDKFFIGRLTNNQRINLMKQINSKNAGLPKHVKIDFDDKKLTNLIAKLTTNFSGAALGALRSRILINFDLNNNMLTNLDENVLVNLAIKVAHDFQIRLGNYSIPELMVEARKTNLDSLWNPIQSKIKDLTGRILINLKSDSALAQFEIKSNNNNELDLIEIDLQKHCNIRFTSDLVPVILDFCVRFEVDNIQLIDSELLLTQAAFDDNAINELVNESLEEFKKYENGIIVYDVDTLVGIVETSSDSSVNESKSYSIQNQRLWQNILHSLKRTFNENSEFLNKRKWCLVISSSEFLIKQFKSLSKFPLSSSEKKEIDEETEKKTKERKCLNCESRYFEYQNSIDACSYHTGALVRDNERYLPINKDQLMELLRRENRTVDEINEFIKPYLYLCCLKSFSEGKDNGCKRDYHSDEHLRIYDARNAYFRGTSFDDYNTFQ